MRERVRSSIGAIEAVNRRPAGLAAGGAVAEDGVWAGTCAGEWAGVAVGLVEAAGIPFC